MPKISPKRVSGQPIDNTTMVIKVAGNEYCVTNKPKRHSKSFSLGSISDFNIEVETTKIDKDFYNCDNKKDSNSNDHHMERMENQRQCDTSERLEEGCESTITTDVKSITNSGTNNNIKREAVEGNSDLKTKPKVTIASQVSSKHPSTSKNRHIPNTTANPSKNYALAKSRSEGNPFHNKKRGKVIQVQRQHSQRGITFCWHGLLQLFDHFVLFICLIIAFRLVSTYQTWRNHNLQDKLLRLAVFCFKFYFSLCNKKSYF